MHVVMCTGGKTLALGDADRRVEKSLCMDWQSDAVHMCYLAPTNGCAAVFTMRSQK